MFKPLNQRIRIPLYTLFFVFISFILAHIAIVLPGDRACFLNDGFALGLFQGYSIGWIIGIRITGLIVFIAFAWMLFAREIKQFKRLFLSYALMLVFSGMIHVVELVMNSGVCDYIRLHRITIFNLNDVVINASLLILIFILYLNERNNN